MLLRPPHTVVYCGKAQVSGNDKYRMCIAIQPRSRVTISLQLVAVVFFSIMLAGCSGEAEADNDELTAAMRQGQKSDDYFSELKTTLSSGTPQEKENVLYLFMKDFPVELVSSVINAILDQTESPRHGDTGWASVHHQAATAMSKFAYRIDGKSQEKRGLDAYSFFNDGGVGTEIRRNEVHENWSTWWKDNQKHITRPSTVTD